MFSKNMKLMALTFLIFLVFWGCQENISDYRSSGGAVVVLSLNDAGSGGILLAGDATDLNPGFHAFALCRTPRRNERGPQRVETVQPRGPAR